MAYEYITKYSSPNCGGFGGVKNQPKSIIVHHWGAKGQKFFNVLNWLCNPSAKVSAHFVVEAGRVACIVDCAKPAYHAGSRYYNTHSIGIESRPECTDADVETLIELIADLYDRFGILDVIGHRDVAATACPGDYYVKLDYIQQMAIAKYQSRPIEPTKPQPSPSKPIPTGGLYRVQVGAFKNRANADNLLKQLKASEYSGFVVEVNGLYKVQVGAFRIRDNADALLKSIKADGFDAFISGMAQTESAPTKPVAPIQPKPTKTIANVYNPAAPLSSSEAVKAGQAISNIILGTRIAEDGIEGPATKANRVKMLQWAMNKDYSAGLNIDGIEGPATRNALGHHSVRQGETQYMVTALEVLLLMNGYNPHGVELPGEFGSGLARCVMQYQMSHSNLTNDRIAGRETFLQLIK